MTGVLAVAAMIGATVSLVVLSCLATAINDWRLRR